VFAKESVLGLIPSVDDLVAAVGGLLIGSRGVAQSIGGLPAALDRAKDAIGQPETELPTAPNSPATALLEDAGRDGGDVEAP